MAKTVAEIAALIHADMCDDDRNGYSWSPRNGGDYGGSKTLVIDGKEYTYPLGSYDCSSSICKAWQLAIQYTKYAGKLDGATYTGNMRSAFAASGLFDVWDTATTGAVRGDVYLNDANHTAMCQDGGHDGVYGYDALSEFCINENGEVYGGKVGDQTGTEAYIHAFYNYPFNVTLHYNGKADTASASSASKQTATAFRLSTDADGKKWLAAGKQPARGSAIRWIAAKGFGKYRVFTRASGWLPCVNAYNVNDLESGCAGDGSPILGVEFASSGARYAVRVLNGAWYADMVGRKDTGGSSDHFAGDLANRIDGFKVQKA